MELKNDMALQTAEEINQIADEMGERLSGKFDNRNIREGIKTNQVRNFFASINSIRTYYQMKKSFDGKIERDLIMLKPQLAYAKGRERNVETLQKFIFKAIDATVKSSNQDLAIQNFFALIEAIVAYHKFYGGRDN